MKKIMYFVVSLLIFVSLLCGCHKANIHNEDTNTSTGTSSADQAVQTNTVDESLAEKLIREIDGAYAEESKLYESSTTVGMIELADKYAERWKQVADEYYDIIMNYDGIVQLDDNHYSADDLHSFVSNMKTNWEEYNQEQCANYVKILQTIYGSGTVVGPSFAVYKYEMQKEWALQIVGIYEQLYIE